MTCQHAKLRLSPLVSLGSCTFDYEFGKESLIVCALGAFSAFRINGIADWCADVVHAWILDDEERLELLLVWLDLDWYPMDGHDFPRCAVIAGFSGIADWYSHKCMR
jgi:hypothetical protein